MTNSRQTFFVCKCSDVNNIGNLKISNYYKRLLDSWSFFLASQTLYVKEDILDQNIFGNAKFSYNGNALFFSSFSLSDIQKIEDIWDDNTNCFKSSTEIFNSLYDRRNWISEYSRIKKAIPQELIRMLNRTSRTKCKGKSSISN
jgi:hypothetical protein